MKVKMTNLILLRNYAENKIVKRSHDEHSITYNHLTIVFQFSTKIELTSLIQS